MPPKVKVTKEEIIDAAVELVRSKGTNELNARTIAAELGCSTQPVFSNFATMNELRLAVVQKAYELSQIYHQQEEERGEYPVYKANGVAYIRFAKDEKELFKLLYMRDRTDEDSSLDSELSCKMEEIVQNSTEMKELDVKLFHLEMWSYVHGIASMFATGFVNLEWELVSKMLTDCYQGLRKQHGMEV